MPVLNVIYVPESTKVLTASTGTNISSAWPSTPHAKVGVAYVQSAASANLDGVMLEWEQDNSLGNGHGGYEKTTNWIRYQPATWLNGVDTTFPITINAGLPDDMYFVTASGNVLQYGEQTFPAFDTGATSELYVVNDSVTANKKITNLNTELTDADGNSLSGLRFNFFFFGVVSQNNSNCKVFMNLPKGSYGNDADAIADNSATTVTDIPTAYKGTGFPIARATIRHTTVNGGTWTLIGLEDLRDQDGATGGSGTAGKDEFSDALFRVLNNADNTKKLALNVSQLTTSTTRTLTVQDKSGEIALTGDVVTKFDAEVSSTSTYTTVKAAIDAGKVSILVSENTTEVADIAVPVGGFYMYIKKDVTIAMGTSKFTYAAQADIVIEGQGTISAAYIITSQYIFNTGSFLASVVECSSITFDLTACTASASRVTVSTQKMRGIIVKTPNVANVGLQVILGATGSVFYDCELNGGGTSNSGCFLVQDAAIIDGLHLSGIQGATSAGFNVSVESVINNVLIDSRFWIGVSGRVSNIRGKTLNTANVIVLADKTSISNCDLNGGDITPSTSGDSEITNCTMAEINFSSSGHRNSVTNCNISGNIVLDSDYTTITATRIEGTLTIASLGVMNKIVGCDIVGAVSIVGNDNTITSCKVGADAGGGANTITVDALANRTIIGDCRVDAVIVNNGIDTTGDYIIY